MNVKHVIRGVVLALGVTIANGWAQGASSMRYIFDTVPSKQVGAAPYNAVGEIVCEYQNGKYSTTTGCVAGHPRLILTTASANDEKALATYFVPASVAHFRKQLSRQDLEAGVRIRKFVSSSRWEAGARDDAYDIATAQMFAYEDLVDKPLALSETPLEDLRDKELNKIIVGFPNLNIDNYELQCANLGGGEFAGASPYWIWELDIIKRAMKALSAVSAAGAVYLQVCPIALQERVREMFIFGDDFLGVFFRREILNPLAPYYSALAGLLAAAIYYGSTYVSDAQENYTVTHPMPDFTIKKFTKNDTTFTGALGSPVLVHKEEGRWEVAAVFCSHVLSQEVINDNHSHITRPLVETFKSTGIFRPVTAQFIKSSMEPALEDLRSSGLE